MFSLIWISLFHAFFDYHSSECWLAVWGVNLGKRVVRLRALPGAMRGHKLDSRVQHAGKNANCHVSVLRSTYWIDIAVATSIQSSSTQSIDPTSLYAILYSSSQTDHRFQIFCPSSSFVPTFLIPPWRMATGYHHPLPRSSCLQVPKGEKIHLQSQA